MRAAVAGFAAEPTLRATFKNDAQHKGWRLMRVFGAAVDRLEDLSALVPAPTMQRLRGVAAAASGSHATSPF